MSFPCVARILGLSVLLSSTLYPCDIVVVGGYLPTAVRQVSGTVIGTGRIDKMGISRQEERESTKVAGARISVQKRTDTKFFKRGEVQYPPAVKPSHGTLKEWLCGAEVAKVEADAAGNFTFSELRPGKYCLVIDAPESKEAKQIPMHESFLIDVVSSGPRGTLVADISVRWPDCSGGSSLVLKPLE